MCVLCVQPRKGGNLINTPFQESVRGQSPGFLLASLNERDALPHFLHPQLRLQAHSIYLSWVALTYTYMYMNVCTHSVSHTKSCFFANNEEVFGGGVICALMDRHFTFFAF